MRRLLAPVLAVAGVCLVAALATPTQGAPTEGRLGIELNRLEASGESCRVYIVMANKTPRNFAALKLDLVMFDREEVIAARLAVDAAPLPAGKTGLKVFDVDGLACAGIGQVLFNDVLACAGPEGPIDDCLALIETSARGTVPFNK